MNRPIVIAEAGVNHNGDLGRAKELVAAAAAAGADYVKFQVFSASELVAAGGRSASYQAANTGVEDQRALLRGLELARADFAVLAQECRNRKVGFLATAFDETAIAELLALGMDRIKIASGELTNTPALRFFGGLGRPILLSTGMATMQEVEAALATLTRAGASDITLLHCTSLYPAPPETLNLRAMTAMAERFGRPVGYSDHSLGDAAAVAAVALGASVIEKHFTLDRSLPGPDHKASLEPDELAALIRKLRATAVMLGDGEKRPAPGEADVAATVRRSWHARRRLAAGTCLAAADIALKRPAHGLPPAASPVGRRLAVDVDADAPIRERDLAELPA
jgi:N-acetylneuraminate synthase/N,N'-diacetyllegionaminate synthase